MNCFCTHLSVAVAYVNFIFYAYLILFFLVFPSFSLASLGKLTLAKMPDSRALCCLVGEWDTFYHQG